MHKVVHQYDLFGNYITTFDSIKEAASASNVTTTQISNCLSGRYDKAGNFIFKTIKKDKITPYYKPVHLYDLEGNYIKSFSTVIELANCLEISQHRLMYILNSRHSNKKFKVLDYMISYTKVDKVPAWVELPLTGKLHYKDE